MIVKTQFKRLDNKGIRPFSVKEDVELEILTADPSLEGIKKTFIKGGKFYGEPVEMRLQRKMPNGNFVRFGQGKGFMVIDETGKGCWLIKADNTETTFSNEDEIVEPITIKGKSMVSEIQNDISYINENPEKKVFGFTYKQIAIVAILVLIARKL